MSQEKLVGIANFNCTFKTEERVYPMLDFFTELFMPAIIDGKYTRKTKSKSKKTTEYFITNTKLIELEDGEIVLVGEHVKRVILEIKQDFSKESGFIYKGQNIPSAPYSTFILLLKNHRVAYFPDQQGSPDIRSFATTMRELIGQHRSSLHLSYRCNLENNDFIFDGIKVNSFSEFKEMFDEKYPVPTINIVPIPDAKLVDKRFEDIRKVSELTFRLYNLNSEIDDEPMFTDIKRAMNRLGSKNVATKFSGPKEIDVVKQYTTICNGKYDFSVKAVTNSKEKVTIRPDSLAEQIPIKLNDEETIENNSKVVYNEIKDREEVKACSLENLNTYNENKGKIIDYMKFLNNRNLEGK